MYVTVSFVHFIILVLCRIPSTDILTATPTSYVATSTYASCLNMQSVKCFDVYPMQKSFVVKMVWPSIVELYLQTLVIVNSTML